MQRAGITLIRLSPDLVPVAFTPARPAWIPDNAGDNSFVESLDPADHQDFAMWLQAIQAGDTPPAILVHPQKDPETTLKLTCASNEEQEALLVQEVSAEYREIDRLRERSDLLATLIDTIPDAIHAKNRQGRYILSNRAHAGLLGAQHSQEVIGKRGDEFLPREMVERFEAEDQAIFEGGEGVFRELREGPPGDDQRWFEGSKVPVHDDQGATIAVLGVARDITEQVQSARALQASEARNRALLDAQPDMFFVLDSSGKISELHLPIPNGHLLEHNEDDPTGLLRARQIAGVTAGAIHEAKQTRHVISRSVVLDDRHFEVRITSLNDEEIMMLVRDVTHLRHTEANLRNTVQDLMILRQINAELSDNLNFNYVVELALDATVRLSGASAGFIAVKDEDDKLQLMNLIGSYDSEAVQTMLSRPRSPFSASMATGIPSLNDEIDDAQRASADPVPLSTTQAHIIIPLVSNERLVGLVNLETDQAGRFTLDRFELLQLVTSRIATYIDNARLYRKTQDQVTELQKLYDEVKKLEQLKTDMIRIASHDLKNPLAGIMGYIEMLQWELEGQADEQQQLYLQRIESAALHMQRIISSILSLERIETLIEQQNSIALDLNRLAQQTFERYQGEAIMKGQTLRLTTAPEPTVTLADPYQLQEALDNLVNNALKYTPAGGEIDIVVQREDERASIRVRDTGYGIPAAKQKQLFTPFYRARTEETREIKGSGLGLHLVKNIIERHDGQMYVSSLYRHGSTFGFDLPLIDAEPEEWPHVADEASGDTIIR